MGEPWFQVRERMGRDAPLAFSSNYALYADMSRRIFSVLAEHAPRVEPYSIDEMFLELKGMPGDLEGLMRMIRSDIRRRTLIPCCVGLGPTKTIAKLANRVAKTRPAMEGVCDLRDPVARMAVMEEVPVSDVWGVGEASASKLSRAGLKTASDLARADPERVRKLLGLSGARCAAELAGTSCIPFSDMPGTRKSLASTRTFAKPVERWEDMREAVSGHAVRVAERLREDGLVASAVSVFMHTSPYGHEPPYHGAAASEIEPSSSTSAILAAALAAARRCWRRGPRYRKCGVVLGEIVPRDRLPPDLFRPVLPGRDDRISAAMDEINARFGRGMVRPLATGVSAKPWKPRSENRSPAYTTSWECLPVATADWGRPSGSGGLPEAGGSG
jgi:DNA polymerase V